MKLVVEINGIPSKDDVLVWDGETYVPISKRKYLKLAYDNEKAIEELKNGLDEYKEGINDSIKKVNEKLKQYHNILSKLVGDN